MNTELKDTGIVIALIMVVFSLYLFGIVVSYHFGYNAGYDSKQIQVDNYKIGFKSNNRDKTEFIKKK